MDWHVHLLHIYYTFITRRKYNLRCKYLWNSYPKAPLNCVLKKKKRSSMKNSPSEPWRCNLHDKYVSLFFSSLLLQDWKPAHTKMQIYHSCARYPYMGWKNITQSSFCEIDFIYLYIFLIKITFSIMSVEAERERQGDEMNHSNSPKWRSQCKNHMVWCVLASLKSAVTSTNTNNVHRSSRLGQILIFF